MQSNQKIYKKCHRRCERCICDEDLLIHHIDRDRSNNNIENLEVLCTSCHAIEHIRIANIKRTRYKYITPPEQLTFNFNWN